jgi:hypothetical protein
MCRGGKFTSILCICNSDSDNRIGEGGRRKKRKVAKESSEGKGGGKEGKGRERRKDHELGE